MTRIFDKESLDKSAILLKRMIDGEPKNVNPLTEIPAPQMRLYVAYGTYFETEEELVSYCNINNIPAEHTLVIDYFRSLAGRSDVIGRTTKDGRTMFYTVVDEDGYSMYNHERSIYRGEFTWEYNYGSIREVYTQFRDRGIVFENDIYAKIDEINQSILKMCRDNNLFNCRKNSKM